MGARDIRIDQYIEKAAPFAHDILRHLRELVHQHCPEANETIKWSMPHFEYGGSIFCRFAAFKQHCSFGFWLAEAMTIDHKSSEAMGQFGRITTLADLPSDKEFAKLIKQAKKLQDAGTKGPIQTRNERNAAKNASNKTAQPRELLIPPEFSVALQTNAAALATFDGFSYSNKKDYVEWYVEAKTEATRAKRLAQTLEWLAEGKRRNWKYEKC